MYFPQQFEPKVSLISEVNSINQTNFQLQTSICQTKIQVVLVVH